jgi:hypothetical protein
MATISNFMTLLVVSLLATFLGAAVDQGFGQIKAAPPSILVYKTPT